MERKNSIGKSLFFYLIFVLLIGVGNSNPLSSYGKYSKIFGYRYQKAIDIVRSHAKEIKQELAQDSVLFPEIIAIVFPELIRYSFYQDLAEIQMLKLRYLKWGHEEYGANLSIGIFQMKPSFIEFLEGYSRTNKDFLRFKSIYSYSEKDTFNIRKERIHRMETFIWQVRYLLCFYYATHHKFPNIVHQTKLEKCFFLATAYNRGIHVSEQEIKRWYEIKTFPYGDAPFAKYYKQHAYGKISVDFYEQFSNKF